MHQHHGLRCVLGFPGRETYDGDELSTLLTLAHVLRVHLLEVRLELQQRANGERVAATWRAPNPSMKDEVVDQILRLRLGHRRFFVRGFFQCDRRVNAVRRIGGSEDVLDLQENLVQLSATAPIFLCNLQFA